MMLAEKLRERLLPFGWFEEKGPDSITFVTDHAGSIPLYYAQEQGCVLAGSTPLEVAEQMSAATFDPVSVADFLLNGTVCYPYTVFKGVYVAPPGAVTEVSPSEVTPATYYRPEEQKNNEPVAYWGAQLREQVQHALQAGVEGKENIKVLFSGGEDSRAIVSLLPERNGCELVTFADGYNREVRLAERAARALSVRLRFIQRPEGFYKKDIRERVRAIGGDFDIRHTHVWGQLAEPLKDAGAVVGGYAADTLFKSAWMGNVEKGLKRLTPERLRTTGFDQPVGVEAASAQVWLDTDVAAAVDERRLAHHKRLQEFRPTSAGNWHTLWPLGSQRVTYAHYLAARLACADVVEPFLAPQVYRLAAIMPDRFRVDRKAFRAAFGPPMGKAGWLPSSSGRIPKLGGYLGHWVELSTVASRRLRDRSAGMLDKVRGRAPMNQGAWSADHGGFCHEHLLEMGDSRSERLQELLTQILSVKDANKFWDSEGGVTTDLARNRLLQISYLMDE